MLGDDDRVITEKGGNFCYHFQVKRQILSVVLLQECLHSNRCDPKLPIFICLRHVDLCISGIRTPAMLVFVAGTAKRGPSRRPMWWEAGKGLRPASASLCAQCRNCPCLCPGLGTVAALFLLEAFFSLKTTVWVDLHMWPWFNGVVW